MRFEKSEIAWNIAKMPVVSGSTKINEGGATAKFLDPHSQEILDMIVDDEGESVHGYIFDEGADPKQIYEDDTNNPNNWYTRRVEYEHDGYPLDDDDGDFNTTQAEFTGYRPLRGQRARALGVIPGAGYDPDEKGPVDWSTMGMLETDSPYKSRGYATALYDLISYYLSERGNNVLIPGDLSDDGRKFWDSARDEGKAGMREIGWFGEGLGWNPPSKSYMTDSPRRRLPPLRKTSDLIKMPIVSGSFNVDGDGATAKFRDPVSDEILDLLINSDGMNEIHAFIADKGKSRASAQGVTPHTDGRDNVVQSLSVDEPYRKRGYATGLYDLISYYLQNERDNHVLIPSADQSEEGAQFWEGAKYRDKAKVTDLDDWEDWGWVPPPKSFMEKSSDLLKMPIVPGSYRAGDIEEGNENYEDRQKYLMDFYDPKDDKTRKVNIIPTWKRKGLDESKGRGLGSMFGRRDVPQGTTADIELDEDEIGEGENLFGRNQKVPFGYAYDNRSLDRLFVPSDMRRRGMGTAIADALSEHADQEARKKGYEPTYGLSDDSDNVQTKDMLAFWANRGYMPDAVYPLPRGQTVGGEEYWRRQYRGFNQPDYKVQGPFKGDFEQAWQAAVDAGQDELKSKIEYEEAGNRCWDKYEEAADKYASVFGFESGQELIDADFDLNEELRRRGVDDKYIHEYDGEHMCECFEGHPWYAGEDIDSHEEKRMTHFPHSNRNWNNKRSIMDD